MLLPHDCPAEIWPGACHDFHVHKIYCSIVTHMQMSAYYSRTCKKEETKYTATLVNVR